MSQQGGGFQFTPSNLTGIAEAVAFIITAVIAFIKGASPVVDVAAIGAALHGVGHGLKTH